MSARRDARRIAERLIAVLLVSAASTGAAARLGAQDPAPTGTIAGLVTARLDSATSMPARGAVVAVARTALRTTTDQDGRFALPSVPAGTVVLRVLLPRHVAVEQEVLVAAGDTMFVAIVLEREAQLLVPVRTDALPTDLEAFVARPNIATVTLGAAAMQSVPRVGEADVVRVAALLPGVVSRNDFNTGLTVRGGEADQNLILLDGYPIYNPFHLGGLFSTFMDATVGGVELITGALPARHGGRLSSILDVRSADETRPGLNTTADLSALGASARVSGVLRDGRGTWSVAARRTYADAAMRLFTDNLFPYHFRDVHARATYALPGDARLSLTAYDGKDVLDANLAEFDTDTAPSRASQGSWAFDWGNRVIGATLAKDVGRATLEQRVSASRFSTLLDLGDGAFAQRNSVRDVRLAGSLLARWATHDASIGYEVAAQRVRYASGSPRTGIEDFDLEQRPTLGSLWIEELWRPTPRWILQAGLRGEALSSARWMALSPRLSLKFFATPDLALTAGAGRVTQTLHSLAGDGPLRYFDVWLASDSLTPVATAWHYVAGAERRLRDAASVRVEGYVKRYDRILEANWSEDEQVRGDEFLAASGASYGIDVLARWHRVPGRAWGGWLAYSWGVSSRQRGAERWWPGHDRRHDLDAVLTWRMRRYDLGARFGFASGTPFTPIVGEIARRVYDPSRDSWVTGEPRIAVESLGGARNGERFPATHRLDLDASRTFVARGVRIAPYVSVANVYNASNVFIYLYDYSTDRPTRRAISQFPVLPSAGVRIAF